jgi:hypothetical protein
VGVQPCPALLARDFFNKDTQPKPGYTRNEFGAAVGGPIIKDKTFFFGAYQGRYVRQSNTSTNTVPATTSWFNGDFSGVPQLALWPGGNIVNSMSTRTMNLVTERKFGDFELYLEFMLAKGSNSGVYHHGLYEVQLFDSYGSATPLSSSGAGGIYQRWENGKGFGGTAPRTNASRPPGQWQSLHTRFRGPRGEGKSARKAEAKFETVVLNGTVVQENVAPGGPTRSGMDIPEAAENPLMPQGDHGPVAFRNIWIRNL